MSGILLREAAATDWAILPQRQIDRVFEIR
jgi:hypothetical protein